MKKINIADKEYNWSSMIWSSPMMFKDNLIWCAYQAYIYNKIDTKEAKKEILEAMSSKQLIYITSDRNIKEKGWKINSDWASTKERSRFLRKSLNLKFKYNPFLCDLLLATKKKDLIYDVKFDDFLGTGKSGDGKNKLGLQLMKIRSELKKGTFEMYKN